MSLLHSYFKYCIYSFKHFIQIWKLLIEHLISSTFQNGYDNRTHIFLKA